VINNIASHAGKQQLELPMQISALRESLCLKEQVSFVMLNSNSPCQAPNVKITVCDVSLWKGRLGAELLFTFTISHYKDEAGLPFFSPWASDPNTFKNQPSHQLYILAASTPINQSTNQPPYYQYYKRSFLYQHVLYHQDRRRHERFRGLNPRTVFNHYHQSLL